MLKIMEVELEESKNVKELMKDRAAKLGWSLGGKFLDARWRS